MIEGIPRISVLVISYNQENVIGRALDSLLKQIDYIYEICISDDCSTDKTWEVILEYQRMYPNLIKPHQNKENVGIFENVEVSWGLPSGDIVYRLAGDDIAGDGWLKKVVDFLVSKQIDYKNERFCIYGDYKIVFPNNDTEVVKNNSVLKYNNTLRLALRGLLCNRSACYSLKVLKGFERVSKGRSHIVEHIQDRQLQLNTDFNYYIPFVGNIYYAKVGVSSHFDEKTRNERLYMWTYTESYFDSKEIKLKMSDHYYGRFVNSMSVFRANHNCVDLLKSSWFLLRSFDFSLLFLGSRFKRISFALIRRLPHKRPISM